MISTLSCQTKTQTYSIVIGERCFEALTEHVRTLGVTDLFIVSTEDVFQYHGQKLLPYISQFSVSQHILPTGEAAKSLIEYQGLLDAMIHANLDRQSAVVAFGGGTVGDISGFAAATYLRGIRWLQLPTTLLAQVDAGIGGKTAINHPRGKNLIGAFHQPSGVYCDISLLQTLPSRAYVAGLAEIIKYGLVFDAGFYHKLIKNKVALLNRDMKTLQWVVKECCRFKASIVEKDELDKHERHLLNFGHTFAHAIEGAFDFSRYLHGEAVAIGMVQAIKLSEKLFNLDSNILSSVVELLEYFGLPAECPILTEAQWLKWLARDKKKAGNKLKCIVLQDIGHAMITSCELDELLTVTTDAHVK